jgi:hypothetical protein
MLMNMKNLFVIAFLTVALAACTKPKAEEGAADGTLRKVLLEQLKNSHSHEEWFAPFVPALADVTAEQAAWTDSTENHSIGQLASHLAFWNGRVLQSFQGNTPPDFKDDNKTTFRQLNEQEWKAVTKQLDSIQTQLEQLVEKGTDAQLKEWSSTIANLAMHNAYHTGQILYIRKKNGWWKK